MVQQYLTPPPGRRLICVDHVFPVQISFPGASESTLTSVTKISVCIYQHHSFIVWSGGCKRRVSDITQITESQTISPSLEPGHVSLRLLPHMLGRFTTEWFRITHSLHLAFHRRWVHSKVTWDQEVEIFQPSEDFSDIGLRDDTGVILQD
jgi:hypothetical protein